MCVIQVILDNNTPRQQITPLSQSVAVSQPPVTHYISQELDTSVSQPRVTPNKSQELDISIASSTSGGYSAGDIDAWLHRTDTPPYGFGF